MGRYYWEPVIQDCLDGMGIVFTGRRLTKKLAEKLWKNFPIRIASERDPLEAHAVYENIQLHGSDIGSGAVMEVPIE